MAELGLEPRELVQTKSMCVYATRPSSIIFSFQRIYIDGVVIFYDIAHHLVGSGRVSLVSLVSLALLNT